MIKMLSLLVALFSLNVCNIASIEEETFIDNVNKAYDEYKVVIDEETHSGDVTIVFGMKKDEYYVRDLIQNEKILMISSFGYNDDPNKANECIRAVLNSLYFLGFEN